jgi:2-polyprenyl-6-methoxyphenol hydroxylase-like FAD-dependent oxidoreductase
MKKILIVGAGPTGLTCALELNRRGMDCRVVDRKEKPSPLSRAVGINPRSLEILEASGITERLIAKGFKMTRANFRNKKGKLIGSLRADMIPHRYNFLVALPQDETERVMQERLHELGGKVEYNIEVIDIKLIGEQAEITLKNGGNTEKDIYDLVVAADGAHSIIRKILDIPFEGYDYNNLWSVADFTTSEPAFSNNEANLFIYDNGEMGLAVPIGVNRYRGASNTEKVFTHLPENYKVEKILNGGTFLISIRQARTYQKGCVYLAGDAAHVHSPAGGRGMNLGIEDAFILAGMIVEDRLEGYTQARHKAGENVLKMSEGLVKMISIENIFLKLLRNAFFKIITMFPIIQKPFMKQMAGLN